MTPFTRIHAERVLSEQDALTMWRDATVGDMEPSTALAADETVVVLLDEEPVILRSRLYGQQRATLRRDLRAFPMGNNVLRGAGIRNRAQVFGYLARNAVLQRSSCRPCGAALTDPEAHHAVCQWAACFAETLRQVLPEQYEANKEAVDEVLTDWLLPGGLWTSGVVNLSSSLPYHRDRNNFDAWSVMPTIRRGTRGGYLHLPELAIDGQPLVLPCNDGDVLFFNGQRFMHGVTPMTKTMRDGYRYSAVYYPVSKMRSCLAFEAELARARKGRTELEETLIERQRESGYLAAEEKGEDGGGHKVKRPRESLRDSVFSKSRFGR